jgi:hypothetical protein
MAIDINRSFERARRRLAFGDAISSSIDSTLGMIYKHLEKKILNEKQREMLEEQRQQLESKHVHEMEMLKKGKEEDYRRAIDVANINARNRGGSGSGSGLSDKERRDALKRVKELIPGYRTFKNQQKNNPTYYVDDLEGKRLRDEFAANGEAMMKAEYARFINENMRQFYQPDMSDPYIGRIVNDSINGVFKLLPEQSIASLNDGTLDELSQWSMQLPKSVGQTMQKLKITRQTDDYLDESNYDPNANVVRRGSAAAGMKTPLNNPLSRLVYNVSQNIVHGKDLGVKRTRYMANNLINNLTRGGKVKPGTQMYNNVVTSLQHLITKYADGVDIDRDKALKRFNIDDIITDYNKGMLPKSIPSIPSFEENIGMSLPPEQNKLGSPQTDDVILGGTAQDISRGKRQRGRGSRAVR